MVSDEATNGIRVGWRFMVISSKIGHGGGGVRLNADGPRPLGRWIERSEIRIWSGIALRVVDRSDSWTRYG